MNQSSLCISAYSLAASLISAAMLLAPSTASAQSKSVTVNGNRPTTIYSFGVFNESTCTAGPYPELQKGYSRAQHGTLKARRTTAKLTGGICKDKTTRGIVVIYTADSGFRGTDTVRLGFSYPRYTSGNTPSSKTATVSVKVR